MIIDKNFAYDVMGMYDVLIKVGLGSRDLTYRELRLAIECMYIDYAYSIAGRDNND